ncbi:hypothetical protein D6C84_06097 [Aureobasidium pullulans]|uniref:MYND-type domain-containing protein n=1 Tax=Aureobasidium pullulans TaxID=5580 RepID=A0A4S9XQD0_AURPU|nr:hypothetical protein D6C84_06097 [Aureobasidium pullulans]
MQPHDKKRCAVCPRPGKPCSRCGRSHYCSKECQKFDWPLHRTLCASFENFQQRPDSQKRRAIYFPVDSDKPKFVWLPMSGHHPSLGAIRETFFSGEQFWPVSIDENPLQRTALRHDILLQCHMHFRESLGMNQTIYALSGKTCSYFKGPAIAYCSSSGIRSKSTGRIVRDYGDSESDPSEFDDSDSEEDKAEGSDEEDIEYGDDSDTEEFLEWNDADPTDLRAIMDFILVIHGDERLLGALIQGDAIIDNSTSTKRFSGLEIPPTNHGALCTLGPYSTVARLFRMPLTLMLHSEKDKPHESAASAEGANSIIGLLMLNLETKHFESFGEIPERFRAKTIGTVAVIRQDGLPIFPSYLEAFCAWIKDDLRPSFADTRQQCLAELELKRACTKDDKKVIGHKENIKKLQGKMLDTITRARFYAWCKDKGFELKHL